MNKRQSVEFAGSTKGVVTAVRNKPDGRMVYVAINTSGHWYSENEFVQSGTSDGGAPKWRYKTTAERFA